MKLQRRRAPLLALALLVLSAAALLFGLGIGSTGFQSVLAARHDPIALQIVWDIRLPRTLGAWLAGGLLGLSGAVAQGLFRNPLADPYLLGISAGASTGAVAVLVVGLGAGVLALSGGAFLGSVAAFAVALLLAGRRWTEPARILLAGVAAAQLFSAATSLIVVADATAQNTRGITFWLLGSLSGASWPAVGLCAAALAAGLLICWAAAPALDAFAFGADIAQSLGFSPARVRALLFVTTALLAAALVAASGAIGFVGLTIPHAARLLAGARHRRLLPACALTGATFLIGADTVARTAFAPQELPVGVVTALIGVPVFAILLRRRTR